MHHRNSVHIILVMDFQGDSVASFTFKVIFSRTCLGILDKRIWNNSYWGTENQYIMHELRFMM